MIQRIFVQLLYSALSGMTPELKKFLHQLIKDFKARAAQTPNPWDDIVAALLEALFCPED